ncbi:MAG TPA: uridine kinase [Aliidongia sp.]|nr:uridine kinase [Aliidongia sp.]
MTVRPILVAIAGGSGAGKTTLARALVRQLQPSAALILSEDSYYRDNGADPGFDPALFNFDDVAAHDHALLARHLEELKAGRAIERPDYCFVTHRRMAATSPMPPADFVLVEGIHILCSEAVHSLFDLRIYLDVPDDVRLARRLLRDLRERGRSVEAVIEQYLKTVRPMHYRHTEPTRFTADLVILDDGRLEPASAAMDRLLAPAHARLLEIRAGLPGAAPAG